MLNPDFKDMLSIFNEKKVEYLIVGAYALAAHGFVRATGDIDFWIRCSDENADRVLTALIKFGAPLLDLTVDDLKKPGLIFQIGVLPGRIDIMTSVDGLEFDEAWSLRKEVIVEDLKVPVISRSDLIRNKRAAGRPKDLADVAWIDSSEE